MYAGAVRQLDRSFGVCTRGRGGDTEHCLYLLCIWVAFRVHSLLRHYIAELVFVCRCAIPIFFIFLPIASFLLSRAVHFIALEKKNFLEHVGENFAIQIPVLRSSIS